MAQADRKTQKMRGSRSHGYGITQKHRGAGSRGGHGMAGSKKHKWGYVSKYLPGYFGKKGFKRPKSQTTFDKTINVSQLSEEIKILVGKGLVSESSGVYSINLKDAGYTKLLGAGKVNAKLKVKVEKCSPQAKAKIEAAGGSVETREKETGA
ncbi:MAG: uL15 family ribosomal protein [Candidatus Altiarchaeota archaeon]